MCLKTENATVIPALLQHKIQSAQMSHTAASTFIDPPIYFQYLFSVLAPSTTLQYIQFCSDYKFLFAALFFSEVTAEQTEWFVVNDRCLVVSKKSFTCLTTSRILMRPFKANGNLL